MQYYSVTGTTEQEIRNSLNKNSPVRVGNNRFDAYTSWNVSWRYTFLKEGQHCKLSQVTTSVVVEQILPRLISVLSPELQIKWDNYYEALLRHEEGHKNFGIDAAQHIERKLKTISPQPTCKQLERNSNSAAKRILDFYVQKEKEYDKRTNYGAKEGATFP